MKKKIYSLMMLLVVGALFIGCPNGSEEPTPVASTTVTYMADGAQHSDKMTVEGLKTIAFPADPTKTNHIFKGWFTDEDLWTKSFLKSHFEAENKGGTLTVYAHFVGVTTITFDPNGGSVNPASMEVKGLKETIDLPVPTIPGAYTTFMGWFTQKNGVGTALTDNYFASENKGGALKVYAYFAKLPQLSKRAGVYTGNLFADVPLMGGLDLPTKIELVLDQSTNIGALIIVSLDKDDPDSIIPIPINTSALVAFKNSVAPSISFEYLFDGLGMPIPLIITLYLTSSADEIGISVISDSKSLITVDVKKGTLTKSAAPIVTLKDRAGTYSAINADGEKAEITLTQAGILNFTLDLPNVDEENPNLLYKITDFDLLNLGAKDVLMPEVSDMNTALSSFMALTDATATLATAGAAAEIQESSINLNFVSENEVIFSPTGSGFDQRVDTMTLTKSHNFTK